MRIAIFVDSRYRDTVPSLLVKKRLQQLRDWDVITVSVDIWRETMELYRPHVVVLNHAIGFRNQEIIRRAKYSVVLPTEGRPNTVEQERWFVEQQDGKIDLFLSWNEHIAQQFKKTTAVATGCPRFDVHYTHSNLVDSKEKVRAKYGLDQNRPVVGVFTSFPQAKFSYQDTVFNQQDWEDLGVDKIGGRENPLAFAQNEMRLRQRFMTAVDAMHDENPSWQLLVKPHPMEDVLGIQSWCDERGYVCITQDTIFNVIAATDAVVNRVGCVTELDAMLQSVPVVSFGEPEDEGFADRPSCQSVSELLEYAGTDQFFKSVPDAEYIEQCGLDAPATERVVRALVENLDKLAFNDVLPTKNVAELQNIIMQHNWNNSQLLVEKGAVGKSAVSSYISTWEERI
jgi:surface carbohydrate biosynthesis protein